MIEVIKIKNNRFFYLDQKELPFKEIYREVKSLKDAYIAIKELRVRGAPLIGVFAGYCIAFLSYRFSNKKDIFLKQFKKTINYLKKSRPTAKNLFWALERLEKIVFINKDEDPKEIKELIINEAYKIHQEDISLCEKIAHFGVSLINDGDCILTHCNTGYLATSGIGTALGIIYKAKELNKKIEVYATETRPVLQGARLTIWELSKNHISCKLITDNMAGYLMQKNRINKIFVGADRVSLNGDVANKIGTYSLAVLAKYHNIPFYVVCPFNTFDLEIKDGSSIPIEERDPDEVRRVLNRYITVKNIKVYNPSFDITPNNLISALITDKGIIYPPYNENIKKYEIK